MTFDCCENAPTRIYNSALQTIPPTPSMVNYCVQCSVFRTELHCTVVYYGHFVSFHKIPLTAI